MEWGPSTRLGAFDPDVIRKLKDETDGLIYVSGSGTLVRALLQERLVDHLRLFVYPVAVGKGKRLWRDDVDLNADGASGATRRDQRRNDQR